MLSPEKFNASAPALVLPFARVTCAYDADAVAAAWVARYLRARSCRGSLLGGGNADGPGGDCPALRHRSGAVRSHSTGRDGSTALVWRRYAGRRRDIIPLAAA